MNPEHTLRKILDGSRNIRFADLVVVVKAYGFRLSRTRGSHNIFVHPDVRELVNLQEVKWKANRIRFDSFSASWSGTIYS